MGTLQKAEEESSRKKNRAPLTKMAIPPRSEQDFFLHSVCPSLLEIKCHMGSSIVPLPIRVEECLCLILKSKRQDIKDREFNPKTEQLPSKKEYRAGCTQIGTTCLDAEKNLLTCIASWGHPCDHSNESRLATYPQLFALNYWPVRQKDSSMCRASALYRSTQVPFITL